ncbi:MAG: TlyA family rRNA (cytidine-2'-O)-methyltransferase, partial [Polyangiaceae bacterium]|nr:TlyA family rRNA (cytidine-2'-O)-methyltransferase [Polyangiaceae bacterium]
EVARGRGVIRDPATREAAIATATDALGASGFALVAAVDSAVHGPKGNVERFVLGRRSA